MSKSTDEQEKISEIINENKNKINELLIKIKEAKFDDDKIDLYRKILNIDNTKEDYILEYLLLLKKINEKNFIDELERFSICISEMRYRQHFKQYSRTNARESIINFINLIKDSPTETEKDKSMLIYKITMLLLKASNIKYKNKKKITWENEELYLYSLYKLLIFSVSDFIIYYNKITLNSEIFKDPVYIQIKENLEMSKNDINVVRIESLNDIDKIKIKQSQDTFDKIRNYKIQNFTFKYMNFLILHSKFFEYIHFGMKHLFH